MGKLVIGALLVTLYTCSVYAAEPDLSVHTLEGLTQSVDRVGLEHRALQLMIEKQMLRRRRTALYQAIEEEFDPEMRARFFSGKGIHTGAYADEGGIRITRVDPGSPAHAAGLRTNDRVLEINDTVGGDGMDAGARLSWAFRRMNPGDLVSVTFLRNDERHTVQVPVISRKELRKIQINEMDVTEQLSESDRYERKREYWILQRQRHGVRTALDADSLGFWDGLMLMNVDGELGKRLQTQIGVLVLASEDPDHPLRAGDVLTQIGHNRPTDAQHAVRLLYDYENQPLIPLSVERAGIWLELELPYPENERMSCSHC